MKLQSLAIHGEPKVCLSQTKLPMFRNTLFWSWVQAVPQNLKTCRKRFRGPGFRLLRWSNQRCLLIALVFTRTSVPWLTYAKRNHDVVCSSPAGRNSDFHSRKCLGIMDPLRPTDLLSKN